MNILIIGSGGREHALAWALSNEENVNRICVSPGNPGMNSGKIISLPINNPTQEDFLNMAIEFEIDLTIVGPENYLEDGIVDLFQKNNKTIYGPNKVSARLESSKIYAKNLMQELRIPTANFRTFTNNDDAIDFIEDNPWKNNLVIKCDGLAAGKGVVVCKDQEHAKKAIDDLFVKDILKLGDHNKILIEEKLIGPELSYFISCCGEEYKVLGHACDYKRLENDNQGPNTGGMGTYSPCNWLTPQEEDDIHEKIIRPLLTGLKEKDMPFYGTLFIGLMMTEKGPQVLEFNVRFGDPETQSLMPRIKSGLLQTLLASAENDLEKFNLAIIEHRPQSCVHVVKASYGYPGTQGISIQKGLPISIESKKINKYEHQGNLKIFYSGVTLENGEIKTSGGRVLGVSALGETRNEARQKAYEYIPLASFDNEQFRSDIAQ